MYLFIPELLRKCINYIRYLLFRCYPWWSLWSKNEDAAYIYSTFTEYIYIQCPETTSNRYLLVNKLISGRKLSNVDVLCSNRFSLGLGDFLSIYFWQTYDTSQIIKSAFTILHTKPQIFTSNQSYIVQLSIRWKIITTIYSICTICKTKY